MSPNWSKVIESLRERRLIPILGGDAVPVVLNGRTAPLNEFLAEELCTRLQRAGVPIPAPAPTTLQELIRAIFELPINEERARNLITGPLRQHLTAAHRELLGKVTPAPETAALKIFAGLPLVITTTIDGAASLALTKACGAPPRRVLNLKRITTTTLEDLPDDWNAVHDHTTAPLLYHLFGRIDGQETFALTDDEMIEYFWKLQGSDGTRRLREAFVDCDIVLLGSAFPDWLLRFVLRLARGRAFTEAASFNLVAEKQLIENQASYDRSLHGFLRQFQASNVWVYRDADPAQFLARLAAEIPSTDTPPRDASLPSSPTRPTKGNIFLSYTTRNVDVARRLAEGIKKHCPVWFDDTVVRGGEELTSEIVRAIQGAHLFVALISRETNATAASRVFVSEWKQAIEVASNLQLALRPYIIPVIIDDLPFDDLAGEAAKFNSQLDLSFRYLLPRPPETDPAAAFAKLIDDLQANYKKVELALAGQSAAKP